MALSVSPQSLARTAARHPWAVVGAWAILLVVGLVLTSGIGDVVSTEFRLYQETESERARRLIEDRLQGPEQPQELVLVHSDTQTVDDPAFRDLGGRLVSELRGLQGDVLVVQDYYEAPDDALVSRDRHTLLVPVLLTGSVEDAPDTARPLVDVVTALDGQDGFSVVTGGAGSTGRTFMETAARDLRTAEVLGMPVALVVLIVVFGALVAAGIPLLLASAAIVAALGMTALIGRAFEISTFVINMVSMMGLAVGIDYSLLIIQRFREERRHGRSRDEAIAVAGSTAARSVLFSGMAVIVALTGLLLVPDSIFRSLAAGAIVVVVLAVASALTLLPAILRLLGDGVNLGRLRIPGHGRQATGAGFWHWASNLVMKHAVISIVVVVGLLVAAAVPYFTINLGMAGVSSLPEDSQPHRAFTLLNQEFSAGLLTPTDIVVDAPDVLSPEVQGAIEHLQGALAADPVFTRPSLQVNATGDLAHLTVAMRGDSQGDEAKAALDRLRHRYIPEAFAGAAATVFVGGETAANVDYGGIIDQYTPIVFAFVLGLSFIILLLVFRSIVVPLKAIVMNLLSVGASYGLMVLVFQHGVGHNLLGFQQAGIIESWVPLFMFSVLFGLSMDYHVFLLTRIRERFDATGDNRASVAYGVRHTAGMITGAALIMVAVFSGFAAGELVMFQQMGFGLAVAVILDATIVRTVLVPASMALLGNWNWYLPAWLDWLPRVHVDGEAAPAVTAVRGGRLEPGT
jgi:RND superfamily putative drug exporter